MLFADGAPAANAAVRFTSSARGYTETTTTSADGTFAFAVVAEMDGQLMGSVSVFEPILKSCPQFNQEGLRLELDSPSCKTAQSRPEQERVNPVR